MDDRSEDRSRIKKKLHDYDEDLKARLDGFDCFFDLMVSNKLISASCSNNIDAIIREFRSNPKLHDQQSSRTTYETFIRVLRESGMDDLADKLKINWSAPHTKSGRLQTINKSVSALFFSLSH